VVGAVVVLVEGMVVVVAVLPVMMTMALYALREGVRGL